MPWSLLFSETSVQRRRGAGQAEQAASIQAGFGTGGFESSERMHWMRTATDGRTGGPSLPRLLSPTALDGAVKSPVGLVEADVVGQLVAGGVELADLTLALEGVSHDAVIAAGGRKGTA